MPRDPRRNSRRGPGLASERLRRLRSTPGVRALVAESEVRSSSLVAPMFVADRSDRHPPRGLPALVRRDVEGIVAASARIARAGVPAVLLFGVPSKKDAQGSEAWNPKGPVPRAIRGLKERVPGLAVIADVCLCGYTDHGHCGVLRGRRVDNDRTLPRLARTAVTYAEAGADFVAPSAMMDHQVASLRFALDKDGHEETAILAYAAKFASGFYGPFRDAGGSAPTFGDRSEYQLDPRNRAEAMRELRLDAAEGADVLMVKPALPYLDIITAARASFDLPIAAFQVSGEYGMIKAAAARGWLDESQAVWESLTAIRRAGANFVVSYFAGETTAEKVSCR